MIWLVIGAVVVVVGLLVAFNARGTADAVLEYERRSGIGPASWVSNFAGRWAGICIVFGGALLTAVGIAKVS